MTLRRMDHAGAAPQTTLQSAMAAGDTSFSVASGTGYPTGGVGPFVVVVDPGLAGEEKILCSSRSGTTFTVSSSPAGRGYDNTVAAAHASGAAVQHVFSAVEADDENDHIYTTTRDDHTQYSRTDGTRAFTGGITVNTGGATITGAVGITGNETVSGTETVSGALTGNPVVASGLTGATAASRYVGATASGAPVSGTFNVGDFVEDQSGTFWLCTVAGTPGTWVMIPKDALVVHLAGVETITGAKTFSAALTPSGGLTGPVAVTGNETVSGNMTVSGTLTVNGAQILPPGVMFSYGAAAAPAGWLLCDGSAVSRTTYAALFSAIGTIWGAGDGSTTFNVPDLRGRAPIGAGAGTGLTNRALAATGGEESHVLVTGELAAHNHGITDPGHGHAVDNPPDFGSRVAFSKSGSTRYLSTTVSDSPTTYTNLVNNTTGVTTNNNGSGTAHNNMQPFAAVTYIIKT